MPYKTKETLSIRDLQKLASLYSNAKYTKKAKIIRYIWQREKMPGLEIFSELINLPYSYLYQQGQIDILKQKRNCLRRKRKFKTENTASAISTLAIAEAGSKKLVNSGGKRTTWKKSTGNFKSAASGQAWNALLGN